MQAITKIVLTGGPCAGKSSGLESIKKNLSEKGYKVVIIDEIATDLIKGGIGIPKVGTREVYEFQKAVFTEQINREKKCMKNVSTGTDEKVIIICDRGTMDNKAYLNPEEFNELLKCVNKTEQELLEDYDAVFHLVSTAVDAKEIYELKKGNNSARSEDAFAAAQIDGLLVEAWKNHSYFRKIGNSNSINEKMTKLVSEIFEFLGE